MEKTLAIPMAYPAVSIHHDCPGCGDSIFQRFQDSARRWKRRLQQAQLRGVLRSRLLNDRLSSGTMRIGGSAWALWEPTLAEVWAQAQIAQQDCDYACPAGFLWLVVEALQHPYPLHLHEPPGEFLQYLSQTICLNLRLDLASAIAALRRKRPCMSLQLPRLTRNHHLAGTRRLMTHEPLDLDRKLPKDLCMLLWCRHGVSLLAYSAIRPPPPPLYQSQSENGCTKDQSHGALLVRSFTIKDT